MAKALSGLGNHEQAVEYLYLHIAVKDSLRDENVTKQIAEMQTKYETEKKEQQIAIQTLENEKLQGDNERQKLAIFASVGGIFLALLLTIFVYRGYRLKQKSNKLLEEKNILIEAQKKLVEERNHDITASITYAQRIQQAMLPENEKIKEALPESFILFMPKDIVSGDFYWFSQLGNASFLAAADCTGHGVPGAFMSMIGSSILTKIVAEQKITQPAEILNRLNSEIKFALKQKADYESPKDGMDIALVKISSTETNSRIEFAGANRPLIYFEENELKEITPDKTAIGGYTDDCYLFSHYMLQLPKGSMIYIFSDGFADQFGGPKGKKFMLKNLKELFQTIKNLPPENQIKTLREVFEAWKGEREQIDDVMVIGVRV